MEHVLHISDIIQPLLPILIYLSSSNVKETIGRARDERPKAWFDFLVHYHTDQGIWNGPLAAGTGRVVQFLQARQSLELKICQQFPGDTLIINDAEGNWDYRLLRLDGFLQETMGA